MRATIASLVVALAASSLASAEPTKADLLFDEGKKLEADGKWQEACDRFQASIQLDPDSPGTLLNLGLCNEKLGRFASALSWYHKAEDHARTAKMREYEQEASERSRALEPRVPVVKIEFAQELPAGGQITLDGKSLRSEDYARFTVDPGKHEIVVTAPHVKRVVQAIELKEGAEQTVKVDAWVETHVRTRDDGRTRRLTAYGVAAAAVALYGVDLYIGFHERSRFNTTGASRDTQNNADRIVKYYSTATFAAGTVAAGVAVYLYLSAPKAETYEAWLPVVGPDRIGLAYDRRF